MKKIFQIMLLNLFLISLSLCQLAKRSLSGPDWVIECPEGKYSEFYVCGFSIDSDYNRALSKALGNAALKIRREYEVDVEIVVDKTPYTDKSNVHILMKGKEQTISARLVDVYYEYDNQHRNYRVWVLVGILKPMHLRKPEPSDLGAMIRSTFIPGWGHFYKNRYDRGIIFFSAVMISAGVTYWLMKSGGEKMRYFGKIGIPITAGIHLLNIIDSGTIKPDLK
ncbi:hypothetical protein JGI3_02258 [Candidatus Kryptobacter tengchongensis]|nr:hypothetical protein JGI3_02258 [Candidatus Kryptobacter tengchongensis]